MNKLRDFLARAKPLVFKQSAGQWEEQGFGFSITLNTESGKLIYETAWGEGDADEFMSFNEAAIWCQSQADTFIKKNSAAAPYAEAIADLIDAADHLVRACTTGDKNSKGEHVGVRFPTIRDVNQLRAALEKLK